MNCSLMATLEFIEDPPPIVTLNSDIITKPSIDKDVLGFWGGGKGSQPGRGIKSYLDDRVGSINWPKIRLAHD